MTAFHFRNSNPQLEHVDVYTMIKGLYHLGDVGKGVYEYYYYNDCG